MPLLISGLLKNKIVKLIEKEGTLVDLGNGSSPVKAIIDHNVRSIEKGLESDSDKATVKPVIFYFEGSQFGIIRQGMNLKVTDEDSGTSITYKVDGPLHPQFYKQKCIYLAAPTFKY